MKGLRFQLINGKVFLCSDLFFFFFPQGGTVHLIVEQMEHHQTSFRIWIINEH